MYEAKKQVAEKTIEKKDAKLKEINNILAEEINPTLSKLKEERSAYLGTVGIFIYLILGIVIYYDSFCVQNSKKSNESWNI
jgi:structural maintenance of chromosome 2